MSFLGSHEDAKKIVHEIEESADIGHTKGMATSPVHSGGTGPGVEMHGIKDTLEMCRTKPKTVTNTLRRGDH